jgi:hypothetical protein
LKEENYPTPLAFQLFGHWIVRTVDMRPKVKEIFPPIHEDGIPGAFIVCRDPIDLFLSFFYSLSLFYDSHLTDDTNLDCTTIIEKYTCGNRPILQKYTPQKAHACPFFKDSFSMKKANHEEIMVAESKVEEIQDKKTEDQRLEVLRDKAFSHFKKQDRKKARQQKKAEARQEEILTRGRTSILEDERKHGYVNLSDEEEDQEDSGREDDDEDWSREGPDPFKNIYNAKAVQEGRQKFVVNEVRDRYVTPTSTDLKVDEDVDEEFIVVNKGDESWDMLESDKSENEEKEKEDKHKKKTTSARILPLPIPPPSVRSMPSMSLASSKKIFVPKELPKSIPQDVLSLLGEEDDD